MMVGFLSPVVFIPESYEHTELEAIFHHELTHLKYFDILIRWLTVSIRCVFWFNPLIWYSFKIMQQDSELVCDYRVVRHLNAGHRKQYAYTLLKYASVGSVCAAPQSAAGRISMASSGDEMKQRLGFISNLHNRSKSRTIMAVVFTCLLAVTTLTTVDAESPTTSSEKGYQTEIYDISSEQNEQIARCCYQSRFGGSGMLMSGFSDNQ